MSPGRFMVSGERRRAQEQRQRSAGKWLYRERAMEPGDAVRAHIVTSTEVFEEQPDSTRIAVRSPRPRAPFVAPKDSIMFDKLSLIVNLATKQPDGTGVTFNIARHVQAVTTFGTRESDYSIDVMIDTLRLNFQRMEAFRGHA